MFMENPEKFNSFVGHFINWQLRSQVRAEQRVICPDALRVVPHALRQTRAPLKESASR